MLAALGGVECAGQERAALGVGEGFEAAARTQRLLEHALTVDAGDDDRRGQPERVDFMPSTATFRCTRAGSTRASKLSKCASITFSGICTASNRKPFLSAASSMARCRSGCLWPVKPI